MSSFKEPTCWLNKKKDKYSIYQVEEKWERGNVDDEISIMGHTVSMANSRRAGCV